MIVATALAAVTLQAAPPPTPDQVVSSVALCVAALEYPGAHPDAGEALAAWRQALTKTPGSDVASQEAAVAAQRNTFEQTAARADSDAREVARAVVILAPNCLSAEAGARIAARFDASTEEAND